MYAASRRFDTTNWSVVFAAAEESSEALSHICATYWRPVCAYIAACGYRECDAEDLTQGFFHSLLSRKSLRQVDPGRGRFRSYLIGALKHFLADQRDRRLAMKRGGNGPTVALDEGCLVRGTSPPSPEEVFDRNWALAMLERVVERLRDEMVTEEQRTRLARLLPCVTGESERGYEELGQALQMTPGAVRIAVHRLRRRVGVLLREQIATTVTGEEVDDEIRFLIAALSSG